VARQNPAFFQRVGFTLKMGGDLLINSKIGKESHRKNQKNKVLLQNYFGFGIRRN